MRYFILIFCSSFISWFPLNSDQFIKRQSTSLTPHNFKAFTEGDFKIYKTIWAKSYRDTLPVALSDTLVAKLPDTIPASAADTLSTKLPDSIPLNISDSLAVDAVQLANGQSADSLSFSQKGKDSLASKSKKRKPEKKLPYIKPMDSVTIKDYKIMFMDGSETYVDTTLTIQKDYKFNFLRKDNFELMSFANMGENFNKLGYDFFEQSSTPQIGARATHYGYFEKEDIAYYNVPSPLTELFFKTTFEQGHHLDALVTVNTSPRFNFALNFRGFRSLGKYVSTRAGASQLRFSAQHESYDKRYRGRMHITAQKIERQVNGGLTNEAVQFFEDAPNYDVVDGDGNIVVDDDGEPVVYFYDGFLDRSRLSTQIRAKNELNGKRVYIDQYYSFIPSQKDSTAHNLKIGHTFSYDGRFYDFRQDSPSDFFLENHEVSTIYDRTVLQTTENEVYTDFRNTAVGALKLSLHSKSWLYFLGENEYVDTNVSRDSIRANQFAMAANWKKNLAGFNLKGAAYKSFGSDYKTDVLSFDISKPLSKTMDVRLKYQYTSKPPNFNFQLYRSDYVNYNWENTAFRNQEFNSASFQIGHKKWGRLLAEYNTIDHYAYFRNFTLLTELNNELVVGPEQTNSQITYYKLRYYNNFEFGKFSLINTLQYQKSSQERDESDKENLEPYILNVPEFISRNTFMFSSQLFKRALYLQTGVTFKYFTEYYADLYNPLIGEFVSQNTTKIGKFPQLDIFVNAKIQQTRVFFKFEHVNSSTTGYRYYSAPFTPFRDSIIRFGLVWNFFQ